MTWRRMNATGARRRWKKYFAVEMLTVKYIGSHNWLIYMNKVAKNYAFEPFRLFFFADHVSRRFKIREQFEEPAKTRYAILQVTSSGIVW